VARTSGSGGTGSVMLFKTLPPHGTWYNLQDIKDLVATDKVAFGSDVALDGNLLLVSDPVWVNAQGLERGRVHAYSRPSATQPFTLDHRFSAPSNGPLGFGAELLLAGNDAFISAPNTFLQSLQPKVYIYSYQEGSRTWAAGQQIVRPTSTLPTIFGEGGMDQAEGLLAVGDSVTTGPSGVQSGVCHLYRRDPGTGLWNHEELLTPALPSAGMRFGKPAVLSANSVAVLAEQVPNSPNGTLGGRVFIYTRDLNGVWILSQTLRSDDFTPAGSMQAFDEIQVDQDLMVVGQSGYDLPNGASQGRAVVYRRGTLGNWAPEMTLERGAAGQAGDLWAASLGVRDGIVVVGAPGVDGGVFSQGSTVTLDLTPGDCNGNMISDACDIVSGFAIDRNGDRILDSCQSVGTPICDPAVANSTGAPSELFGLGLDALGPGLLQICGSSLPPGEFGYMLGSSAEDMIVMPGGSSGNLCLAPGQDFGRFVTQIQQFSQTGIACTLVDFGAIPTGVGTRALTSGDTWYFQLWHRDGSTSNFSPAIEITIP
jgi:hypothetical protein